MKVQVIEVKKANHVFDVEVSVGKCLHTFPVEVLETKIGDSDGLVASGNRYAWETLQYNARALGQIYRLVLEVYNGGQVSLPATITEHLALSPILARQTAHVDRHNGHNGSKPRQLMPPKVLA